MARVRVRLDRRAVLQVQTRTAYDLARAGANSAQARARRYAPKRTGALAASIHVKPTRLGPVTSFAIGSDLDYAAYQEWGTGPIYARPGGVLAWVSGGRMVFARHTSGVPATHFMARTLAHMNLTDFL